MNDPEHFIARWSRRKQQAADGADEAKSSSVPATSEAAPTVGSNEGAAGNASADQPGAVGQTPPAFDLTQLPSLDAIAAGTDLRAFLAPGVPSELTRAALSRAWALDPAIRDFVGLAEYDWDFNTPGSAPGFGPLEMTEELRQALADMMGGRRNSDEPGQTAASPGTVEEQNAPSEIEPASNLVTGPSGDPQAAHLEHRGSTQDEPVKSAQKLPACDELTRPRQEVAAAQHSRRKVESAQGIINRPHGRALPK
jgi:Protein of unknown function (DUF3306)